MPRPLKFNRTGLTRTAGSRASPTWEDACPPGRCGHRRRRRRRRRSRPRRRVGSAHIIYIAITINKPSPFLGKFLTLKCRNAETSTKYHRTYQIGCDQLSADTMQKLTSHLILSPFSYILFDRFFDILLTFPPGRRRVDDSLY